MHFVIQRRAHLLIFFMSTNNMVHYLVQGRGKYLSQVKLPYSDVLVRQLSWWINHEFIGKNESLVEFHVQLLDFQYYNCSTPLSCCAGEYSARIIVCTWAINWNWGKFLSVNAHILYFTSHSKGFVSSVFAATQKDKHFKFCSLKHQWGKMFWVMRAPLISSFF